MNSRRILRLVENLMEINSELRAQYDHRTIHNEFSVTIQLNMLFWNSVIILLEISS